MRPGFHDVCPSHKPEVGSSNEHVHVDRTVSAKDVLEGGGEVFIRKSSNILDNDIDNVITLPIIDNVIA